MLGYDFIRTSDLSVKIAMHCGLPEKRPGQSRGLVRDSLPVDRPASCHSKV